MPACYSILWKFLFQNPAKEYLAWPRDFVLSTPPTNKLHPEYPQKVDPITLGILIVDVPNIILDLIRNIKKILMIGVTFVRFVTNSSACDGGRYTIAVLREINVEISFMKICLMFRLFVVVE